MSDTVYSIINHTMLHEGENIIIGDPAVCDFFDCIISLCEINKKFICVSGLPAGGYFSYHKSTPDMPAFAKDLLFLHESAKPDDDCWETELGLVCTALSDSVFICEEDKTFDAEYTYFALENDALYDAQSIINYLDAKDSLLPAEKELRELCVRATDSVYVSGADILSVTGTENMLEFLKKIPSTHWSIDIARRLSAVPAIPLVGGVASNVFSEFVRAYAVYRDEFLIGIRICLEVEDK